MPSKTAAQTAPAKQSGASSKPINVPWRDRPLLSMTEGAGIAGVSVGTLYNLAAKGEIELKRFGGRTMIHTASLIAALDGADEWQPLTRTKEAVAARAERARAAWAE